VAAIVVTQRLRALFVPQQMEGGEMGKIETALEYQSCLDSGVG